MSASPQPAARSQPPRMPPVVEVLTAFLRLGLTSFGGPVAHLGYFRAEFVERRRWLDEEAYIDIVALCQFLPGPASSQTGITLGILRAGLPGAVAAWLGFSGPSALAMILFGYGVGALGNLAHVPWLHGLKIVAVAVVAQAVWGMARTLCPDRERASLAVAAALLALWAPAGGGGARSVLCAAARPAASRRSQRRACARADRQLLPLRCAGLRRRACRSAAVAAVGSTAGLARQ